MRTKILFIILIIFILFSTLTQASWQGYKNCPLNRPCDISIFTVNTSNPVQLLNATCNITVYAENYTSTVLTDMMTQARTGLSNYTIQFTNTGHYPTIIQCYGTDVDDTIDFTFEVNKKEQEGENMSIIIPLLLASLGLLCFILSFFKKVWPLPLLAFILLISASIISTGIGSSICEAVNGVMTCTQYEVRIAPLSYIFGGIALLALMLLIFRIFDSFGQKNIEW